MYKEATRTKIRFLFSGEKSVEDLWELDVECLDVIYKNLKKEAKESEGESLLESDKRTPDELLFKIDIVTDIIKTKLEEEKQRELEAARWIKKQKLLSILSDKRDEELNGMTVEQLEKEIDSL